MRTKSLAWLTGVTIVAVIIAALVSRSTGPRSNPLAGQAVMPEVASKLQDVARLALVHGDQKTTLVRKGDTWVVEERGSYAAETPKVRQALLGLADLRYVEPKTSQSSSYARLEVEDAGGKDSKSTMITLADTRGALLGEAILGKHRADQLGGGEGGVYVRKPGNAQSWLARGNLDLAGTTASWLDKKLQGRVKSVRGETETHDHPPRLPDTAAHLPVHGRREVCRTWIISTASPATLQKIL